MTTKTLALAAALAAAATAGSAQDRSADELLEALEGGGHVIYFRHAATDWRQRPREEGSGMQRASLEDPTLLRDCGSQRNLDREGREEALAIGEAIEARGIPVGAVLSSPFCRTVDHALLSFGRVEITGDVHYAGSFPEGAPERRALAERLRARLSEGVEGANVVIIAHGNNFDEATGVMMEEGEAAVVRPSGEGFEILGRLSPEEWATDARG